MLSVFGPVADQAAGLPTWRVKPALRRAWREVFDADLGEPTLTWVAQAIQDRQPAAIGWRAARSPRGRPSGSPARPHLPEGLSRPDMRDEHAARRANVAFPGEWRRADLELPADVRVLARVPDLLRALLTTWGEDARQLTEDAQLVTSAVLATALDRADPTTWPRLALTFRAGVLRVGLTVELADDTGSTLPTPPARERRGAATLMLDTVASDWDRRDHPGGERIWFELRARGGAFTNSRSR
jgi:hypothetical protein